MTRDEAIKDIEENILPLVGGKVISLRMAIDALKQPERITGRAVYQAGYADGYNSAQSERKTGKWEQVEVNYPADMDGDIKESMAIASMFCPKCKRYHNEIYLYGSVTFGVNYCPNCGAKMEGEEDG